MKLRFLSILTVFAILAVMIFPTAGPGFIAYAEEDAAEAVEETENSDEAEDPAEEDSGEFDPDEYYAIVPQHGGSTLLDQYVGSSDVKLHIEKRAKNQMWKICPVGEYYYFQSGDNNKVIELASNTPDYRTNVRVGTYTGADNQLFKLDPNQDGTYCIRSKLNEQFCMDVSGAAISNDTNIALWACNRNGNQRFRFVNVSTVESVSEWGATRHDCFGSEWDSWDGTVDTNFYYKNKGAAVYEISTARELAGVAKLNNDGTCDFTGKTIVLTADINLSGNEWTRIGNSDRKFKGSFNGGGHTIIGLTITGANDEDGFFGEVFDSSITNFAIKGSVMGDENIGGVVGKMDRGHIVDVYSEVEITRSTDDNEGGICGRLGPGGYIEHCTQNARVNSGDSEPDRGGICGYQCGLVRYCVNKSSVDNNHEYVGGISGRCIGKEAKIEYCANYGQVSGGGNTKWAGGICGATVDGSLVFGCVNSGAVFSSSDDCIGGICGERKDSSAVYCCINTGDVAGEDKVGGIIGYGNCSYCFNAGLVAGKKEVGAITGKTAGRLEWCRALPYSAIRLHGDGGDNGAEWISAQNILGGKLCCDLNRRNVMLDLGGYGPGYTNVFYQNLGGDTFPTFTGREVVYKDGKYTNGDGFEVRVDCDKGYGTVKGAGTYSSGPVTLTAEPADGCDFDHFEVSRTKITTKLMFSGVHDYPSAETKTYKNEEITLTDNIDCSYSVKAVFKVYDEVPDDLRQKVKVELECIDNAGGWNSDTIPAYLIDSSGNRHLWEIYRDNLAGNGKKVSHTFDIGANSPVAVEAHPNFGGGMTFRSFSLKTRMWINNAGSAIESSKSTIKSYPFVSSKYGNNYMNITFDDNGNSTVGILNADGTFVSKGSYTKCSDAWEAAKDLGSSGCVRLTSAWLVGKQLELNGKTITLDLNGYPMIRTIKKTTKNGGLIKITDGSQLKIIDSAPTRQTCSAFAGGSIQGGRNTNGGGLIDVDGSTLDIKGGALYNGGTTDVGGAIRCKKSTVKLKNTLISNCWSNKARVYSNDGGGIAIRDGSKVEMTNCTIRVCTADDKGGGIHINNKNSSLKLIDTDLLACKANDDEGGAIYQDNGNIYYKGGNVRNCFAYGDDAGGIYQNDGELYVKNISFERNEAKDSGGAAYIQTDDVTNFIGCTFTGNTCQDDGGAVYLHDDNLYMEDCTAMGNASKDKGGAVYLKSGSSLDLCGITVFKDNDGTGNWDNLVLENKSYLYDQGLEAGSLVRLRSEKAGKVQIMADGTSISEYQVKNFLKSDSDDGLSLKDVKTVSTKLEASAFTQGIFAIIIGAILIILAGIGVFLTVERRKEGGQQ